jgi:methionyl aminopeptidase
MSITDSEQLDKLRACGQIVAKALCAMAAAVRPGVTTGELSDIGSRFLAANGAHSSPPMVYGFPGDVCISVNDEVVHGIPGDRLLQPGDLVKLDLTAEKDGYHTDSAVSVEVPPTGKRRATIHECPSVPNYADPGARALLTEGLVITIEPIIAATTGRVSLDRDGWTVRTADGSLSAHYEHTIVITRGEPILLTIA